MRIARLFAVCVFLVSAAGLIGPQQAAFAQASASKGKAGEIFTLQLPASDASADTAQGTVQFIGTATVLIRYHGFTILTDPNFLHKGDHVHLGYGLTSERKTNPAISFDQLPPIDLVLLSHFHGDHFDQLVQKRLDRAVPIVSTRQSAASLRKLGFTRVTGLNPWDRLDVNKGEQRLRVTATPGRHGPAGVAALLPKVMGSVLDFGLDAARPDYRMYISGDTLVIDDIQQVPQRFPGIDLALLHLGGTRILGVVKVTMDGKDGVRMMQVVRPRKTIPIHYNDYDVFKSPLEDFAREVKTAGLEREVVYLAHGETYTFMPAAR
jgi:L-ascorbate metabolism protein UlaG (beta-lactamase superfamily)